MLRLPVGKSKLHIGAYGRLWRTWHRGGYAGRDKSFHHRAVDRPDLGADLVPSLRLVLGLEKHRSEEHTSELQSPCNLVCRLLLEKKKDTEEEVLRQVQADLQALLTTGRIVHLTLDVAPDEHPWRPFAGMFADDPDWDAFQADIHQDRDAIDRSDAEA